MTLSIRPAVTASPDYPFAPVNAPIKLDQNEAAHDFPAHLKAKVLEKIAAAEWNRYPDLNSESIAASIGKFEQWPNDGIVVTTGSNVLISLLTQLAGIGQRVVTAKPNFALYALGANLLGATLIEVPLLPDYTMDMAGLQAASEQGVGVLYLPQPHAPTGSSLGMDAFETLVRARPNWVVVIDEAYHQYAGTDARSVARAHPNVVILRTFSKAWGLAGLRMGYALTSAHIASQLQKLVPPFASSILQAATLEVALANPSYVEQGVALAVAERERMQVALKAHPSWVALPSAANFILIRTPDAKRAREQLLAKGVLIRRQDSNVTLEGCIRVTIGQPHENDAFIAAAMLAS
jgi:histidinol-phosphate aminotransferase